MLGGCDGEHDARHVCVCCASVATTTVPFTYKQVGRRVLDATICSQSLPQSVELSSGPTFAAIEEGNSPVLEELPNILRLHVSVVHEATDWGNWNRVLASRRRSEKQA